MVFSAKSRNSAGTSSFGSIMVAILQFELRVTTFPERRLCGVCLDRQRWTPISGLTFATSGKPASLFCASCAASGCDAVRRLPLNPQSGFCSPKEISRGAARKSCRMRSSSPNSARCAISSAALRFTRSSSTPTHHLLQQGRVTGTFRTTECTVSGHSSSDPIRSADLLSALFVARLLLSLLVTYDGLIGSTAGPRSRFCGSGLRLWHALLAAMFAALILYTFQIVFSRHCDRTLLLSRTA